MPRLQLCPLVWTPTCFPPCDLLSLRRIVLGLVFGFLLVVFFFLPSRDRQGKHLSSVFCVCCVGSAAVGPRLFPGSCFDFAGRHEGVTAAFATTLEGFSKRVQR